MRRRQSLRALRLGLERLALELNRSEPGQLGSGDLRRRKAGLAAALVQKMEAGSVQHCLPEGSARKPVVGSVLQSRLGASVRLEGSERQSPSEG